MQCCLARLTKVFCNIWVMALLISAFDQASAQRVFVTEMSTPDWLLTNNRALFFKKTARGQIAEIRDRQSRAVLKKIGVEFTSSVLVREIRNSTDVLLVTNPDVTGRLEWAACLKRAIVPGYFCGRVRRPEVFRLSIGGALTKIYTHHSGVFGNFLDAIVRTNGDLALLYPTGKGLQLDLIRNGSNVVWSRPLPEAQNGAIFENNNTLSMIVTGTNSLSAPLHHLVVDDFGSIIERRDTGAVGNGRRNFGTPEYLVFEEDKTRLIVHGTGDLSGKPNAISIIYLSGDGTMQTRSFSWKELSATGVWCAPEAALSAGYIAVGCKARGGVREARFIVGRFENGKFRSKTIALSPPCEMSSEFKWSEIAIDTREDGDFRVHWVAYARHGFEDRKPSSCSQRKTLQLESLNLHGR